MNLLIPVFLIITYCILSEPEQASKYAELGLDLWFTKMIPSLLPFMILSGVMIKLRLTDKIASFLYPILYPLFRVSKNVIYAIMTGFLCGFPMGARVTAQLLKNQLISKREAEFLLAFCNNIGPVYFMGYALPILKRKLCIPYLIGMYGIPFLYGMILRMTLYRDLNQEKEEQLKIHTVLSVERKHIFRACEKKETAKRIGFMEALEDSIVQSGQGILVLGGYMILFNLLNLIPHTICGKCFTLLAPIFEISGGLSLMRAENTPLYSLLLLVFGGLSCIAQTSSSIKGTELRLSAYVSHKGILVLLTAMYYLLWKIISPETFLN